MSNTVRDNYRKNLNQFLQLRGCDASTTSSDDSKTLLNTFRIKGVRMAAGQFLKGFGQNNEYI